MSHEGSVVECDRTQRKEQDLRDLEEKLKEIPGQSKAESLFKKEPYNIWSNYNDNK